MLRLSISILIFISFSAHAQVTIAPRNNIILEGKKVPVARAFTYAPNVTTRCSGSVSGGAQLADFGFSLGGSYTDEFCERAELVKMAKALGFDGIANELFYSFPMVEKVLTYGNTMGESDICNYPTDECKRFKRGLK